ncbi:MAG: inositol oxygenase [bacterium]|nr:inositol oxygenase [bacterium]
MSLTNQPANAGNPLNNLEEWDDFVESRYPDPESINAQKKKEEFRDYRNTARECVKEFYRLNHLNQSLEFVKEKQKQFLGLNRMEMGIWEAVELLNTLVDDSDPDIELSQLEHLLQTSEAIRRDGHPDWMVLTGLIHDLGKILCLWGEPQWAVVGDTFPVGCAFSDKIVFPEFFDDNPDKQSPGLQTKLGIYEEGCGLDAVNMSWGHDEYMYHVAKDYLPEPALYMIRYHSFYPAHREGEYDYLMTDHDREMFKWVKLFNPYDLYSKSPDQPDPNDLKAYYQELIAKYFPEKIRW